MLAEEALRLCRILVDGERVSPLLNLGSSTRMFREVDQPHVARLLFEPLERAGIAIVHSDPKEGDGIDLVGDVLDPPFKARLARRGFNSILLANVLEHVRDRKALAAACEDIIGKNGLILATVPSSYPYHADPIDTLYRPSPDELASLFSRSRTVLAEELVGPTYAEEAARRGSGLGKELALTLFACLISLARPRSAASRLHRWRWLGRPYRISIALVQVR